MIEDAKLSRLDTSAHKAGNGKCRLYPTKSMHLPAKQTLSNVSSVRLLSQFRALGLVRGSG
jgi:hypothetical protein